MTASRDPGPAFPPVYAQPAWLGAPPRPRSAHAPARESWRYAMRGTGRFSIVFQNAVVVAPPADPGRSNRSRDVCQGASRTSRAAKRGGGRWRCSTPIGIPDAREPCPESSPSVQRRDRPARRHCHRPRSANRQFLIADEPTTGLDATIQVQVLATIDRSTSVRSRKLAAAADLPRSRRHLRDVRHRRRGVRRRAARAGLHARGAQVLLNPYTRGLVRCLAPERGEVEFIPGRVPEPGSIHDECSFMDRCELASERCSRQRAVLRELRPNHWVACHNVS